MDSITLQKEEAQIVGQCQQAFSTALYSKFGCTAILHGISATPQDFSTAKKPKITPEERYSIDLPKGLKVSVWKDDLTTHKVDAVVNAANEDLNHIGGLAFALAQAGGQVIQKDSDEVIRRNRKVPTGEAVVTSAGNLPCKKVIHAVGPQLSRNASQRQIEEASRLLANAIDNILQKVEEEHLMSVAIPALSSGIFNFPLTRCADIIVNRLKKYDSSNKTKIQEVRLVNHDEPTVSEMAKACKEILGPPKSYSGAVRSLQGISYKFPVKLNNVTLRIIKGHIERQKTSVIVNTTAPELDLYNGAVSRAILKEAGRELQHDIDQYRKSCSLGDVLRTKGYNLQSSFVYHVLCAYKTPGNRTAEYMLGDVVSKCLRMAATDSCHSIAFPAIGSGVLGFSKGEVAQIMTKAVKDFSTQHRDVSMDVSFVIFPSEEDTFQAFAKEHASLQHLKPNEETSHTDYNESYEVAKPPAPYIELRSTCNEVQCAAKTWINDVLNIQRNTSVVYSIRNNHVLHFGLQEHEELLSFQTKFEVGFQVFFINGQAGITITGTPSGVTAAVLEVEAMCCKVQQTHAQAEEVNMLYSILRWRCKDCPQLQNPEINATLEKAYLAGSNVQNIDSDITVSFREMEVQTKQAPLRYKIERICFFKHYIIEPGSSRKSYFDRKLQGNIAIPKHRNFNDAGLHVVRVEEVENHALTQHFELNKKRISSQPRVLYQRVPAQCCPLVSWVGFQREYAPPDVEAYGQGIYFSGSVKSAMDLWKGMKEEEYVYIIEANVLTGKDTLGSPDLIIPPSHGDHLIYDSVKGGTDTFVIFNGHQALPMSIYTCRKTQE